MFKHKGLQQQLVDAKLQQTAQLIKEADEKHQREREFVSSISLKKYITKLYPKPFIQFKLIQ